MATAMNGAEAKLADRHWAYQKPIRPALPRTDSDWPRNAIDFFVLPRLKTNKLKPSPAAPPEQLLRRVHLDLIGLPPSPAVLDAFLANPSDADKQKLEAFKSLKGFSELSAEAKKVL